MGTLDLIVTHYREPWEVGKQLFDMIAMQREVDFRDISVILVNDGTRTHCLSSCLTGIRTR